MSDTQPESLASQFEALSDGHPYEPPVRSVIEVCAPAMPMGRQSDFIGAYRKRGMVMLGSKTGEGRSRLWLMAGDKAALGAVAAAVCAGRPKIMLEAVGVQGARASLNIEGAEPRGGLITCEAVFHPNPDGDGKEPMTSAQWDEWDLLVQSVGGECPLGARPVGAVTFAAVRIPIGQVEVLRGFRELRHLRTMAGLRMMADITVL